jgi:acetylornithine deacetylase/succinyl-diaminopimelate desuccinylase-like protein
MASIFVANMIRYKKQGYKPERDLILALTADEELGSTSKWNGANWLVKNNRDLIDAEFGLNEGGGGELKNGKPLLNRVQAAEKVSVHFRLEVKNPGGHSSRPRPDNAIYELAEGLAKFGKFHFPVKLNETTRLYFSRSAQFQSGQIADDMRAVARDAPDPEAAARLSQSPTYNSTLRTTCVATRLDGGHANNALPQTARATVNCRILPDDPVDSVLKTIQQVVGDKVTVTRASEPVPSAPSALGPQIMGPLEKVSNEFWPGVPVIPAMSTGATDSRFMRNGGIPMYGLSGLFIDQDDNRSHGLNERMPVKSLYDGHEFLYRLVIELAGGK